MPKLDGSFVFGEEVTYSIADLPLQMQRVQFFGVGGVAQISGGYRGKTITIKGKHAGTSRPDLTSFRQALNDFKDGYTHTLDLDEDNLSYTVTLDGIEDASRIEFESSAGRYQKYYQATFFIHD
jgi:hypothetical protein